MIESTGSAEEWSRWCVELGVDDVYWSWPHLELWAAESRAEAVGVRWSDGRDTVLHPVLRSDLGGIPGGSGHCDLRTAYDFGGPLWVGEGPCDVAAFEREWRALAAGWGAVTEFLRLHPFRHDALPSDAVKHSDNLVVDLGEGYDAARGRYYGSFRRDLQKAERQELRVAVSPAPSEGEVEAFGRLYALTMERVGAPAWYRFDASTLAALFALEEVSMVTVYAPDGDPASAACLLRSGDQLFYHLSASAPEHRRLHPAHLALDTLVRTGCETGCDRLHLGGGAPSLLRFKSRLASGSVPYYIVQRVLDPAAYGAICSANTLTSDGGAFPPWLGLEDTTGAREPV